MFDCKMEQFYPDDSECKIVGHCEHCNATLKSNETYYFNAMDNEYFCTVECIFKYYAIKEV